MSRAARRGRPLIGWREWVALPDLGVAAIKAKIDTGARTSALHAYALEIAREDGREVALFEIHPIQRSDEGSVAVRAPVTAWRSVRSSDGRVQRRPTITTTLALDGEAWPIDVTLTNRDEMGFRMLIGRRALRRRVTIDPGRSFLGNVPGPSSETS